MAKAKVAILRTRPETVVEDYRRLSELAGLGQALDGRKALRPGHAPPARDDDIGFGHVDLTFAGPDNARDPGPNPIR